MLSPPPFKSWGGYIPPWFVAVFVWIIAFSLWHVFTYDGYKRVWVLCWRFSWEFHLYRTTSDQCKLFIHYSNYFFCYLKWNIIHIVFFCNMRQHPGGGPIFLYPLVPMLVIQVSSINLRPIALVAATSKMSPSTLVQWTFEKK